MPIEEYDGGTIMRECPDCGQFCKVPDYYHVEPMKVDNPPMYIFPVNAFAKSYCKRCKKDVKLSVEFI